MVEYSYKYEWTQNIANVPIIHGLSLKELFEYEDNTLWYFFNKLLHNKMFNTYNKVNKLYPISKVLYRIDNDIPMDKPKKISTFPLTTYLNLRIRNRALHQKDIDILNKNIILKSDQFKVDPFWDSIISKGGKGLITIEYDRFWNMGSVKDIKNMNNYIGAFYDKNTIKEINKVYKFILGMWNELRNNKAFRNLFVYNGHMFYEYVESYFDFVFKVAGLYIAEAYIVGRNIVYKGPNAILIDSEENVYGQACILHSKYNKVKTIALSYEAIYDGCLHSHIKDNNILIRQLTQWRPLPTLKIVKNNNERDILINYCNYPKSIIKVLGDSRYDELKDFNSKMTFKTTEVDIIGPKVFYAPSLRDVNIDETVMMKIPLNSVLFIKIHPNYSIKPYIKKFKELIKKYAREDLHISIHKYHGRDLIYNSDVVIIDNSSIGIDALLLNKPLICINKEKTSSIDFYGEALYFDVFDNDLDKFFYNDIKIDKHSRDACIKDNFVNFGSATDKILKEVLN